MKLLQRFYITLSLSCVLLSIDLVQADPSVNGVYQLESAVNPTKCMDVSNPKQGVGANFDINDCANASSSSRFNLVPVAGSYGLGYQIVVGVNGLCLDNSGASTSANTLLDEWSCGGPNKNNQIWQLKTYQGSYQLISVTSGMCVDLTNGSTTDGNLLQQYPCSAIGSNTNQLWNFVPTNGVQGTIGSYQIIISTNPNKCLDVPGGNLSSGVAMEIYDCKPGQNNQLWSLVPIQGGTGGFFQDGYQIISKNSGLCLDVMGGDNWNGATIDQATCSDYTKLTQIWTLQNYGGSYQLVSAGTGRCLDLSGGTTVNGNGIDQWDCGNGSKTNQLWNLTQLPPTLDVGPYQIVSARDQAGCLDVSGGYGNDGDGIDFWSCEGINHTNQLWNFVPAVGSYGTGYNLVAVNSGKCLDLPNGNPANGTKLQQYDCSSGDANQIWKIQASNGFYQLVSAATGKCLDLTNGDTGNGNLPQEWDCGNGNLNQLWTFFTPAPVSGTNLVSASSSATFTSFTVDSYNAAGSIQTSNCSGSKGSSVLNCPGGTADFSAGQGIMITGGGAGPYIPQITVAPTPNSSLAGKGTHKYCYEIVTSDAVRGMNAPSPAGCISNIPLVTNALTGVWFSNVSSINAASPNLMFYVSLDGGPYQLIGIGGQNDWGIVQDQGQRPGDLGGWPSTYPFSSTVGVAKNEDFFATVQSISGNQIFLSTALLNSTSAQALIAHDDTAAVQAAINAAQSAGGGVVQFGGKSYNLQRPVYTITNSASLSSLTLDIRQSPWWAGAETLAITGNNVHLNGAGKQLTHLIFGPQQNDNSGNIFDMSPLGVDPFANDKPIYRINSVAKGSTQIVLSNPSSSSNFQPGDDLLIYGGNISTNATAPVADRTLDHFSEHNTVASVGSNGQLNLVYSTSKKYYTDSLGDPFGIINLRGMNIHNFSMSNMWMTIQNSFFRGQPVYNTLVDTVYVDGHSINTFGGGGKQGLTVQNSTWIFGNGVSGWLGIDEYDQFVNVNFLSNQIYGVSAPGSEGPSASAQIFGTEGSSQFTFINNDLYNMEIEFQDTTDDVFQDNRFHNAFLNVGTRYGNGSDHSYLSYNSQASATVENNSFTINGAFAPPWVMNVGHFDAATISGNTVNYSSTGGVPMILTSSGTVSGNEVITGSSFSTYGIVAVPDLVSGMSVPPVIIENNTVNSSGGYSWDIRITDPGAYYSGNMCVRNNSVTSWGGQVLREDNPSHVNMSCSGD